MGDHRRSDRYWTPPEALGAAMETPFQEHDKYQIAFATDLFEKKIFPESTLARPINRILRSTSKTLNFAKVAVAAVAIVWCVGLFKENKNLSAGKDQVLGLVQEVDQTMHNMNRREFSDSNIDDAKYLNEQTIKILNKMAGINVTRSFSIFIPSSWLSGYDDRLEKATALAWNDIVLRSIFSGLQEKARKLFLPLVEKEADNNEINPVKKVSFLTLNQFVIDSNLFEHNVSIYNDLEKSENIEDVGRLVRYLYGVDLPATFYENSFYYQNALGQTKGGDISVTDYATPAQRKLQLLYDRFLETIFDPLTSAVNMPLLTSAMDGLINLASDREMDQVKLYKNIEITLSMAKIISDPDMKWIEGKDFNPSPVFSDFLNNVVNSRIMGVKMNRLLRDSVQAGFVKYKAALKDLSVPLIGIIFASKDGAVLAQPSINYQELVKNLGNLLQQPFMVNLPVVQSISPIPPGRLLFWDESTLARAGKMVDTYDTYVAEQLPLLSEDLRRVLRSIGRFNLTKHVFNNVAKAETFRTQPQSITGFDEQEALQQQVQNLKLSQPYFDKILGQSMTGTLSMQESRLRDLLGDYAYGILTRIDNILVREDLYGLGDDKLNWWQGVDMLGLRAFGVYDLDDMKSYLAAQKDRINLLGKDLAAPVLNFLNTNFLRSLNRNGPLKEKWTRIVLQLDASDKKIPGNSVSVLEHFLQYDLNQVGYDSCYELVDAADHLSQTGDFFLDRRNRIRSAMVDRCKYLLQTKGVEAYNKLAHFFNMYLSGRFPFTASNAEETAGIEAMAADVEVFLSMFDALGSVERQTIETYFENTGSSHSPGQFLQQIEMIRPLLQASLDGNMNMHLPKLDLEVAFRTDRNRESGGDKIIDWAIAIDGKTVDFWDQKHVGEWHVGEDVVVDLQWAADGFVSPLNDSANPNLQVIGNTARFVYKGRWSLVRLIKAHATDVVKFSHATPIVLQFNVPTTHTPPKGHPELEGLRDDLARVYLSLNISLPAKAIPNGEKAVADTKGAAPTKGTPAPAPVPLADKPKSKPLSAPMFPVSAPVLTKGQVVR
jgi:type VI secretion system protein ImpL